MDNQTIRVSPILAPIVSRSIRENKMGEGRRQGRMEGEKSCEKNNFEEVQIGESSI